MTVLGPPKVTQTMRETHLETTFDINCNPRRHIEDRTAKDTVVIDVRTCTTIMASANRAANNNKY